MLKNTYPNSFKKAYIILTTCQALKHSLNHLLALNPCHVTAEVEESFSAGFEDEDFQGPSRWKYSMNTSSEPSPLARLGLHTQSDISHDMLRSNCRV